MCRLLLACAGDGADDIPLDSLVKAKSTTRSKLFGLQRGERLHGFGVAWLPVRGPAGCVVTLRPPLDDLNVRRVAAAAGGRVALAHVRSCACDSCPATTYCPASEPNCQPFARGELVFAHVGILAHHRALAKSGGEAARRADAAGALDCGNSDSAFLFRVFVSLYDETRDVAAALRRLAALVAADAPPSSLNFVAADGAGAVALRFRSPGDGRPPPPLWPPTRGSAPSSPRRDDPPRAKGSPAKKRIYARQGAAAVDAAAVDAAVAELAGARAPPPPTYAARLAACGAGGDGDAARAILAELEAARPGAPAAHALALLQARMYDARYEDDGAEGSAGGDKAGVEEVKDVMASESAAFRGVFAAARRGAPSPASLRVLDFGSGDGRYLAEFCRTAAAVLDCVLERGDALEVVAYDVSAGALRAFRRRCLRDAGFSARGGGPLGAVVKDVAAAGGGTAALTIAFVRGDAVASPEAVEALLRCGAAGDVFDVAVVSSANNFMGPQQTYADLRAARDAAAGSDAEALDARIRLATRPGDFYYPVAGHDYFFSAVTPARERQRLLAAGFAEATISACNVVSFRDILGSAVVAKLELAALRLVDADDHLGLQRLLALGAARATGEKARRTARLFDPDRTLVDQAARYLISVARR
ncbi:glutamine amidotransferase [Aureococcus anophagefferens]|nr:glutamine amidotransferase [Aureococcus anophagefferens]